MVFAFAISALKIREGWGLMGMFELVTPVCLKRLLMCFTGDSVVNFKLIYLLYFKLFTYFWHFFVNAVFPPQLFFLLGNHIRV